MSRKFPQNNNFTFYVKNIECGTRFSRVCGLKIYIDVEISLEIADS